VSDKTEQSSATEMSFQSLTCLKGVGPKLEEKLQRLGIYRPQDMLFHLPLRYQDRTCTQALGSLRAGQQAVIEGHVDLTETSFYGKKRILLCHISDGTGAIILRFFHFSNAQKAGLARGTRLRCFGEVRFGKKTLEMIHPEYQRISDEEQYDEEQALTPVYPTTDGIHQIKMRDLMQQLVQGLRSKQFTVEECLPASILAEYKMPLLRDALLTLHEPTPDIDQGLIKAGRHPAQQRLVFEELLAHYLSLRQLRKKVQNNAADVLITDQNQWQKFNQALPFSLTAAQIRVIEEIRRDMLQPIPMMRLVQGDVGSGKTLVAAAAAITAIASGFQVALMAPTEILAEQHLHNFNHWLSPLGIEVVLLGGKLKAAPRREAMAKIASAEAQMVIGTHALFQDEVEFNNLALVIIDEQHRFGVHQRMALRDKCNDGKVAHQLIMTATPIPRTLAMTAYADLDVSIVDELPPGRIPVTTVVIPESRRAEVLQRVKTACATGSQAYWVCTLIDESESLQCQAAVDTAELLQQALPGLRVGLVHGRLKPAEKQAIMAAFKAGEIDLLVATTVIEVGVDVPNANLMIIENAERLGLSQLHQLRGRVGRGGKESSCALIYQGKLSQNARKRLAAMRESNDGFYIAQQDLELRGPGELLGTRQTGIAQMRIADIVRDQHMMPAVMKVAEQVLFKHEDRVPLLIRRWLGDNIQYGTV